MLAGGADGNGHLPRPRRARHGGGGGGMGSPPGQAASAPPHPAPPLCTDYDVAYFKAYSHIGAPPPRSALLLPLPRLPTPFPRPPYSPPHSLLLATRRDNFPPMLAGGAGGNGHLPRPRRARRGGMGSSPGQAASAPPHPAPPPCTDYDVAYFKAYSHIGVHEEMLKDHVRTNTYRNAIMHHRDLISGKVVLDVGCGTGVLSIFCAFAGATRVYAVDASDIALQAMEIVRENELSDKVIVLHGRIEDVNIEEKVDVIISEWMGYMLLYESMLGSVIFARDKWLKPGGLILPSHASLYLAPITNSQRYQDSIYFWRDIYGIKMSSMMPLAKQCAFMEPSVETISGENVLTWPTVVAQVDCYTIQAPELETITAAFKFTSMLQAPLHGFAFWFDVEFNGPVRQKSKKQASQSLDGNIQNASPSNKKKKSDVSIVLSTAPEDAPTHWQQTLLYLFEPIELKKDQIIEGSVTISQSQQHARFLNICMKYFTGDQWYVKESVMR